MSAVLAVASALSIFAAGLYARVVVDVLRLERARRLARPRAFRRTHSFCCDPIELPSLERLVISRNRAAAAAGLHVATMLRRRGYPEDADTVADLLRQIRRSYVSTSRVVLELRGCEGQTPRSAA